MDNITRFNLELLGERKLGYTIPPYIAALNDLSVDPKEARKFEKMTDQQLLSKAYIINEVFPLSMNIPGTKGYFKFPLEPMISVKGKNKVIFRDVAKGKSRGSVKEIWTQDDYSIEIRGVFLGKDENTYPLEDLRSLINICEAGKPIKVKCELLRRLAISKIVITDWDIPFTKGKYAQGWSINAVSDDDFDLFIPNNNILTNNNA